MSDIWSDRKESEINGDNSGSAEMYVFYLTYLTDRLFTTNPDIYSKT